MKLVTFSAPGAPPRPGLLADGRVHPLPGYPSLEAWLADPDRPDPALAAAGPGIPLAAVRLHAPLRRPPSLRDFYAFEAHVRAARRHRGLEMVPEWYEFPVFYFSNAAAIYGPEEEIPYPRGTAELDYELEVAAVIGRPGRNLRPAEALDHVAGWTILNDWSARDLQRREMKVGLGPAKGKDFATSLGPWLVTPEELADRREGDRYRLEMVARVNGVEYSRGNFADIHFTMAECIARASVNVTLYPGDVIGSGTVGTGCLAERPGRYPWLQPGDVVELEVERLGVLRNRVGAPE